MKTLFETNRLSGMELKNRFLRSATYEGRADDVGHVTEELISYYEELAKGGVGAIITGLTTVSDIEKIAPKQSAIYNDSFVPEYKRLTDTVHKHNARIIIQLACNGAQTMSKSEEGICWAPSVIEDEPTTVGATEMTKDDIATMKDAFAKGALRAKDAGFDAVQLHAAHGYLLSRFLTPYYNRRTDEYGGSLENRTRILLETIQEIKKAVGDDYPLWVKINSDDFMDDGLSFGECKEICKMLENTGIEVIEISGGTRLSRRNEGVIRPVTSETESYFANNANEIAQEINIPVISVGGHRDIQKLTKLFNESKIEYFSFCRPFIREPNLINRWINGDESPAKCTSCTKCFGRVPDCIFNK